MIRCYTEVVWQYFDEKARDFQMYQMVQRKVSRMFSAIFGCTIGPHPPSRTHMQQWSTLHRSQQQTNALWTSKTFNFLIFSVFSLRQSDVVGRRLEKDVQSGELVVLVPPREVSQQQWLICQILASRDFVPTSGHHLQFGTLPCSLACTHSAAKWNGFCSGDNTRGRGCLCSYYVSYALSQRVTTSCNEIKVVEAS